MESTTIPSQTMSAWQALLSAHSSLVLALEQALAEDDLPPVSWYEILSGLAGTPDGLARPRDLGCGMTISRSGMTRLLDRIEAAGLVERRACDTDRRGTSIVTTEAGRQVLDRMRPVYERELQACFAAELSEGEAETLARLLGRVAADD